MTTQIAEFISPAGGTQHSAGQGTSADGGVTDQAGSFSALMATHDDRLSAVLDSGALPAGGELPSGGQLLPPELPPGLSPAADVDDPLALLESLMAPGSGFEDLAGRLDALLSAGSGGFPSLTAADGLRPVGPAAAQGQPVIAGEMLQRLVAALRAEFNAGQSSESLHNHLESGMTALTQTLQQFPASAAHAAAMLQKAFEQSSGRLHSEGLKPLLQSGAAVDPGATPVSATTAGQSQSTPSQIFDRGLPGWTLNTPLHQPQWGEEVGQRIRWMVSHQMHAAELRINPPQLGPVEVRINMHNDQMNITFLSQHAQVRDTIEDAVPRLRELMTQQGFSDVNVDVSQHQAPDRQQAEPDAEPSYPGVDADHLAAGDDPAARIEFWSGISGNIDYYA